MPPGSFDLGPPPAVYAPPVPLPAAVPTYLPVMPQGGSGSLRERLPRLPAQGRRFGAAGADGFFWAPEGA
jgi:hypothetical protein